MSLEYFYKQQSEQFSFIRIPKAMMTEEVFAPLSMQAKILYGMLLDRMGEAMKNRWIDDEGKAYVIYPISEIQQDMNISKGTSINCIKELEDIGLVEKKMVGQGRPNYLYVKNFVPENA